MGAVLGRTPRRFLCDSLRRDLALSLPFFCFSPYSGSISQVSGVNLLGKPHVSACPQQTGGTLYVGDYIPDTVPFAAAHYANTIEVYFCDWEYAYNNIGSGALGCQNQISPTLANAYTGVLSNP
jgi:hypothetical protein